ncbi:DNA excision repair protein ERCC-6-like [Dermacentor variabilis]|uniref:DNA excision repair protein ERCC-6-like n=1 Tax=Dermacentor variabilis TaxID=34621 RepID=UPI003F5B2E34
MMASAGETDSLFKRHKSEGKKLLKEGNVHGALQAFERAVECQADDRLQAKMEKMREFLKNEDDQEDCDTGMIEIGKGFFLYQAIEKKLYAYQKEGLLWMWGLHLNKRGGVLGDDMGLGKTIQVVAFLSGMFDGEMIKSVLIIMPVSLIANWKKEFEAWAPGVNVYEYHSVSKKERERNLARVQRRGGVLLTSYGMAQTSKEAFCTQNGQQFVWCYLILDEGHKIKNQTKTTKAIYEIPAKHRLVLTGTAVQNNLQELWALFNFAHQGALVGSSTTFKNQYENPINRAREKDATTGERLLGATIADQLRNLIKPYFLRRTKAEVLENKENSEGDEASLRPKLTFTSTKNDLVIWIYLSELQKKIYREFLESDEVANTLMTKKSPLVQLTVLKKICDHPRLLSKRACVQMGMYDDMTREEIEEFLQREEGTSMSIGDVSDDDLLEESGKMTFVLQLLTILRAEGHRTLLFSQSRKILDIINRILIHRSFRVTRLDGTISKLCERDRIVTQFQSKDNADVFLLTTQVGGVGLTLTSADRVIIYDPSWNPATDAQAVDRAYRIGQQKNVVVYRLITCSTVEEKIYRRQIFKDSIIKQTTGKQRDPIRYFTKQELRELFALENPNYSGTQVQLSQMHSWNKDTNPALEDHIALLQMKNIFGVSHHDLMFSEESQENAKDEFVPGEIERVEERARMAQHMITVESDMVLKEIKNKEFYTVPINNAVKVRPTEQQAKSPKRNLLPGVPNDPGDGMSSKWNKALVVPDDDVHIDGVDLLNKSLASMTFVTSENGDSIIVDDSEEELFSSNEDMDSIVIDTDEESSYSLEEVDTTASSKMEKQGFLALSTADNRVFAKAEDQLGSDAKCDVEIVNIEQPGKEPHTGDEQNLMADRSFQELHESPAEFLLEVQDKQSTSEQSKSPSLDEREDNPTSKATLQGSFDKGAQKSACRSSFSDNGGSGKLNKETHSKYLHTMEHGKRLIKKRLWNSPSNSSFIQIEAKHFQLSPSILQKERDSDTRTTQKDLGTPQNQLPGMATSNVSSPAKPSVSQPRLHSTPLSTPPKRIAPFFVGSPQRFSPSSCQKVPPSPFQEALAKSVEYAEVDVTPLKVQQTSAAHSSHTSVHFVSPEDEEDVFELSSDDVVFCRRLKKKTFVITDSSDETP